MRIKTFLLPFVLCLILSNLINAQQTPTIITWRTLSDVIFKEEYNKEYDFNVMIPSFGAKVKALEGKVVEIEGYAIPINETGFEGTIVLSAMPYSQCFFCGLSGPESVMDIKTTKKIKDLKVDKKMKFRGKLKLNARDMSKLNYILNDAVLISK